MRPTDFRGVEIGAGDTIAWPGRQGSNLWMTSGTVVEVVAHPGGTRLRVRPDQCSAGYRLSVNEARIDRTDRVVVIRKAGG